MQSSTVDQTQSANIPTWVREALASLEFSDGAVLVEMMRDAPKGLAVVEAPGKGRLVFKQFKDRRGEATRRFLDQLTHAGLAAPGRFRVSRAHAWLEHNHTLVTDEAAGTDWGAWFEAEPEKLQATSEAVAQWVAALQQLTVQMEDRSHLRDLTRLRREANALAAAFPTKSQWLGWIIEGISEGLGKGDPTLVPSHGDLHLDEVFITDGDPPVVTVVNT